MAFGYLFWLLIVSLLDFVKAFRAQSLASARDQP